MLRPIGFIPNFSSDLNINCPFSKDALEQIVTKVQANVVSGSSPRVQNVISNHAIPPSTTSGKNNTAKTVKQVKQNNKNN